MRRFNGATLESMLNRLNLPDDVPIEAKMVTKAIERAQNTVEGRNAEVRKDVLKYDEVLNEQRKIIYKRRLQVIDGDDLHDYTVELLEVAMNTVVTTACPSDYPEEWDLSLLIAEVTQYYPTKFSVEDLAQAGDRDQLIESLVNEALDFYEQRPESFPGGEVQAREIEREVMLQVIDQRWRDHLAEMDYLREGINLRAVAQQDPLVAWQREGYSMFGQLMEHIDEDYLRYILHVDAVAEQPQEPDLNQAVYVAAEDPVATVASAPLAGSMDQSSIDPPATADFVPVVKADHQKVGRNDPCWCGSAKKFKQCHGAV
jgi:preprotein translocase subunit SecA